MGENNPPNAGKSDRLPNITYYTPIRQTGSYLKRKNTENGLPMTCSCANWMGRAPSFLMVLTGVGDYAYLRSDGVFVVPVGCLKN